jgi:hypothetical protein
LHYLSVKAAISSSSGDLLSGEYTGMSKNKAIWGICDRIWLS